jgi:hypothetical protein
VSICCKKGLHTVEYIMIVLIDEFLGSLSAKQGNHLFEYLKKETISDANVARSSGLI